MRMVSGEGLFKAVWTNEGTEAGFISLTNSIPSTIIPINLDAVGGSIMCSKDAFLAAINPDVRVSIGLIPTSSGLACCFSGMTPVLQRVAGTGWVRPPVSFHESCSYLLPALLRCSWLPTAPSCRRSWLPVKISPWTPTGKLPRGMRNRGAELEWSDHLFSQTPLLCRRFPMLWSHSHLYPIS